MRSESAGLQSPLLPAAEQAPSAAGPSDGPAAQRRLDVDDVLRLDEFTDASHLSTLRTRFLRQAAAPGGKNAFKACRKLRRAVVRQLSRDKAERAAVVGKPQLDGAREHVRFFLPKTSSGELLSLRCSEKEFSKHVGAGVSLYMRFQKVTGYMFLAASVVVLPQLLANHSGHGLELPDPFQGCPGQPPVSTWASLTATVSSLVGSLSYLFFSSLLGNASFDGTHGTHGWAATGWAHLLSELMLCCMFCVYVYWIWQHNSHALEEIDEDQVRASDFAVCVRRLPAHQTDPEAVKAHFAFFGPVASVAIAVENEPLMRLIRQQQQLKARWRRLHLLYARELQACPPRGETSTRRARGHDGKTAVRLLGQIEAQLAALVDGAEALRQARQLPAPCTGYAFVVFQRMRDAARCVRHFELIRRHERRPEASRDGTTDSVDYRQLYFRRHSKIEVSRACEPSDIIWHNLQYGRRRLYTQNVKTTALVFLLACCSTSLITLANIFGTTGMAGSGLLTTVWVTAIIVGSNVVIFGLVPHLAINSERHHYRSTQQTHMLVKMAFFQVFNTTIAVLAFLLFRWSRPLSPSTCPDTPGPSPPPPEELPSCLGRIRSAEGGEEPSLWNDLDAWGIHADCVQHWYHTGAFVLMNALFGDLTVILGVIDLVRPDKLITRYVLAPRAATQVEMNGLYAQDADFYLPFRYQLALKIVCLTLAFCPAVPLLLPYAAIFMFFSYRIDRYNLLRVMKPPPRTAALAISMSVLYILPLAVFAHIFSAIFFYSKRAGVEVPTAYYAVLAVLALFIMVRISAELRSPSNRPLKDLPGIADVEEEREMHLDSHLDEEMSSRSREMEMAGVDGGGAAEAEGLLRTHLDDSRFELYVPPLTTTLLNATYEQSAERTGGAR